jgi:hypothetical protein
VWGLFECTELFNAQRFFFIAVDNVTHAEQNIGTVNKDVAERFATIERNVIRRVFGLINLLHRNLAFKF